MTQFLDEARIFVKSGKGGNGIISFRREKYVPRGGPAGGDGGHGGHVMLVANRKLNTLRNYGHQIHYTANDGKPGGTNQKTGASASDLVLEVPVGTVVRDAETGRIMADLTADGQRVIVAKGGRGGRGNVHWKSANNQVPQVAEKGEPGEERWITLELKLLADVGIIGMPNVGKSTLLSVISNAKPQIADYPFTTLVPNLGVVALDWRDAVFADIPGLIEGAHTGLGLGHAFLRHVQRTRVLVHLVNGMAEDPIADFHQINTELSLFDEKLMERPQIVAVNKMDIPEVEARYPELEAHFKSLGYEVMPISAATQMNTRKLVNVVFTKLDELPEPEPFIEEDEMPLYSLPPDKEEFTIEKVDDGIFRVSGQRIERTVAMTYFGYHETVRRFQRILETLGISAALEEAGVKAGDTVIIGETELEWSDE